MYGATVHNGLLRPLEPFPLVLLAFQGQLSEIRDFGWAIIPYVVFSFGFVSGSGVFSANNTLLDIVALSETLS